MSTDEFIIDLFCRTGDVMDDLPKHPQAKLYLSEVVTLALLVALKGVGARAFYRWLVRDYQSLSPSVPERTWLFRVFVAHRAWVDYFLAEPTVLGVADGYAIELVLPIGEIQPTLDRGRQASVHRESTGISRCLGQCTGQCLRRRVSPLIADFADDMVMFTDMGFHAKAGDPPNMKPCPRNTWNVRMVVETVLAMLPRVCQVKKLSQGRWPYVVARLSFTMALFSLLVQWDGLQLGDGGHVSLSFAQFSL
jgi:hypothetical protein